MHKDILYKVNIIEEPEFNFPTNNMKRHKLMNYYTIITKRRDYDIRFEPRQTNYYNDGGIY